jgi:hypothetical protein
VRTGNEIETKKLPLESIMTKITFALAAAVLAGTTMTSAANAGGVRLGFGFPLGNFVAHSNQNYDGDRDYRHYEKPRHVRRDYQDDAPARKIAKVKRAPKADVADVPVKAPAAPVVNTAKLENKLASDPATTTVLQKAPAAAGDTTAAKDTTTGSSNKLATTDKTDTVATSDTATKSDSESNTDNNKHVCRRYSAAIAGLVDVPCE